jgi:hypothetical protein
MANPLSTAVQIIKGAPAWAWGVLIYLLAVRYQATKRCVSPLYVFFLIPVIFMLPRYKIFQLGDLTLVATHFGGLVFGGCSGYVLGRATRIIANKAQGTVETPGNYQAITVFLLFFAAKYTSGYWQATALGMAEALLFFNAFVSVFLTVNLLGRAFAFARKFHSA